MEGGDSKDTEYSVEITYRIKGYAGLHEILSALQDPLFLL